MNNIMQPSRRDLSSQWRQVGVLRNIYAFPIKSCAPVLLTEAECTYLGLQNYWLRDRFLMVVNERHTHVSAKDNPVLLTVQPSVWMNILTLRHKDMEPLQINLVQVKELRMMQTAYVCDVGVSVMDCGSLAGEWFTKLLAHRHGKCRLVYYASDTGRPLKSIKQTFSKQNTGALSDEAPYHLISQSSVDELKGVVVSPLDLRPNLVISGAKANDEDGWKFINIGQNIFEVTKNCTRFRNEDSSKQKLESGSRMGVYMILRSLSGGIVSVNDPVLVVSNGACSCEAAGCYEKTKGNNEVDKQPDVEAGVIGISGQQETSRAYFDSTQSGNQFELKKRKSADKILKEARTSGDEIFEEANTKPTDFDSRNKNDDANSCCRSCSYQSSVIINKNE